MRPQSHQRWSRANKTPSLYRDWMLSLNAGTALYYGGMSNYDLDPLKKIPKESNLSYSMSVGKWVKPYLAVRANLQMGNLHAVKSTREMNANFNEYSAQVMINLTDFFHYVSGYQKDFYSYVFVGYGFIDFSSAVYYSVSDTWVYEGQDKMSREWVIPAGIGLGYNVTQNFTFTFDASYHYAHTDKLDAYPNQSKDFLLYLALGMNYNFNIKEFKGYIVRPKSKRSLKWAKF